MKKKLIIFTAIAATALCVTGSIAALTNNNVVKDLVSSTVDFENEKEGIEKVSVRKSATTSKLKVSKIYAQYAHNNQDGYDYLRFATSVKGNYSDITYTRSVEGKEDEVQAVHSVYKGISANGEITYSNGSDLRTEAYTSTEGCYWACYTIKFTTDTYKDKDITIKINVDGVEETRTVNFAKLSKETPLLGDKVKEGINFTNFNVEASKFALGSDSNIHPNEDFTAEGATVTRGVGYVLGMTSDGTNVYYAITKNESYALVKFDPTTKTHSIIVTGKVNKGTTDFRSIVYKDKVLYLIGGTNQVEAYGYNIEIKNWVGASKYSAFNTYNEETIAVNDFGINPTTGEYVVLSNDTFRFYDSEGNYLPEKDKALQANFVDGYSGKKITSKCINVDSQYIYVYYKQDGHRGFRLGVYDWTGNLVKNIAYGNKGVYPSNSDFSNGAFTIVGGKLYFSSISGWNSGGANSEIYSVDFDKTKSDYSLQEKLSYAVLDNSSYGLEQTGLPISIESKGFMQGATTDGTHLYYLYTSGGNTKGNIVKYDAEADKIVGVSKEFVLRTASGVWTDNGNMFYYNGRVYVTTDSALLSVSADDLGSNKTADVLEDTTLPWITGVTRDTFIIHNPRENVFYVQYSDGYVKKYSVDGELIGTSAAAHKIGEHQGFTLINGNVYVYGSSGTSYKVTEGDVEKTYFYDAITLRRVYSDMTVSGDIYIGNSKTPLGAPYTTSSTRDTNIQNVVEHNGELYICRLVHGSKGIGISPGAYVSKLVFDEETLLNTDRTKLFGEKIESASFNEEYAIHQITNKYGSNYVQGLAVIGDDIYVSNSTNEVMYIAKYNPETNTFVKSTNQIKVSDSTSGNYGRIFAYNNQLWAVHKSGEVLGIDLETLAVNGNKLELTGLPSGAKAADVKYVEDTGGFAVLDTSNRVHILNESMELVTTIFDIKTSNGREIKSISVSGTYIYVVSSKDSEAGLGINTYDINGNHIKDLSIVDSRIGGSSSNISCVADYKGKLLVTVLTWGNAAAGGLYAIDVK